LRRDRAPPTGADLLRAAGAYAAPMAVPPMSESVPPSPEPRLSAVDEVVGLLSDLIRLDTTNTGDPATLAGERTAAEWVAEKLGEVGYETTYVESGAKGRGNVIARLPGSDPDRGALLVHGHLDVVPADGRSATVTSGGGAPST
jgi:acetylornithine deacetylase/succinyl-diaminopimelate desuccinylase-like protein